MNIIIGTLVLMALAGWVWRKLGTPDNREAAYAGTRRMVLRNTPRLVIALISAGLFAELLPDALVRQHLGDTSGFKGVALGMVLGILTPGGAFVSFALAAGAMQAGATAPAMMAYVTAWALFALTKLMAEEFALLGPQFILRRVAISLPVPSIVGGVGLGFGL